jgi:filamentous hemagglutinin
VAQAQAALNNSAPEQRNDAQHAVDLAIQYRDSAQQAFTDAQTTAAHWGPNGDYTRDLKVVTAILVGGVAGQGAGQLAANASAPYAANAIGDYFAQPGHENQTAQLLSHAVLGAVLAAANGSSAAGGAGAGASGELAAQVLSRELYPQAYDPNGIFHPENLDASQRQTVIALSTAVGAFVAGAAGGTALDASVGGSIAMNAATNNWLSDKNNGIKLSEQQRFAAAQKKCAETHDCVDSINLAKISALRDANLKAACDDSGSVACGDAVRYARVNGNVVNFGSNNQVYAYPIGSPTFQAMLDPRQGTFHWTQAANLNDGLTYAAIDSATGLGIKGIVWGAKGAFGSVGTILSGATKSSGAVNSAGRAFATTDSVVVNGTRAIDLGQSYEVGVRSLYGDISFQQRQYTAIVSGGRVNGIADTVTSIAGRDTAVEAKFVDDWATSLRNPNSANGGKAWAVAEQQNMVNQAAKYSAGFDGGVIYHTNSAELAAH